MLAAGPAVADGGRRVAVDIGQAPWSSLVRVQAPGLARCTGVLLAPDRVATAAHCLFSRRLGHFIPPGSVNVLLAHAHGSHAGHAVAATYATAAGFDPRRAAATRGADLAVIMLATPLRGPALRVSTELGPAAVVLGGYQRDRPEVPTADLGCRVLAEVRDQGGRGLLAHDCAAIQGSSGAPVLRQVGGTWQVIGIQVGARPGGPGGVAVPAAALRALLEDD